MSVAGHKPNHKVDRFFFEQNTKLVTFTLTTNQLDLLLSQHARVAAMHSLAYRPHQLISNHLNFQTFLRAAYCKQAQR